MTTKTKQRRKIDLEAMIGPLDLPVEPKTLEECLYEAGGFPFTAKVVSAVTHNPIDVKTFAVGEEITFMRRFHPDDDCLSNDELAAYRFGVRANIKRWQLLGHKT